MNVHEIHRAPAAPAPAKMCWLRRLRLRLRLRIHAENEVPKSTENVEYRSRLGPPPPKNTPQSRSLGPLVDTRLHPFPKYF